MSLNDRKPDRILQPGDTYRAQDGREYTNGSNRPVSVFIHGPHAEGDAAEIAKAQGEAIGKLIMSDRPLQFRHKVRVPLVLNGEPAGTVGAYVEPVLYQRAADSMGDDECRSCKFRETELAILQRLVRTLIILAFVYLIAGFAVGYASGRFLP